MKREQIRVVASWEWDVKEPDINLRHETAVQMAVDMFNKPGREDTLIGYWIIGWDRKAFLAQTEWNNPREKDMVFWGMPYLLRKLRADSYSFICEVWVARMSKEEAATDLLPSEHPNHEDALHICTEMKSGGIKMTKFIAKYPKPFETWKVPRLLERDDIDDATHFEGNAMGFFKKE